MARVDEALDVLLAGEPERSERCHPPRREAAEAALLQREPDERERSEDEQDLRSVREVLVHRAGLRAREAIGEGVCDEDSGRSDRRHQDPGKQAPTHVPRMMPAGTALGGGSPDRERRGIPISRAGCYVHPMRRMRMRLGLAAAAGDQWLPYRRRSA